MGPVGDFLEKTNVHDRRPARVLPIEGLLKSYCLAGG